MGTVLLRMEKSKSRTGKHAIRDIALVVDKEGTVHEPRPRAVQKAEPVYSRGDARVISVHISEGSFAVQVHLVRNLRGHVKGYIEVYDGDGRLLYRAVYRKLKLRYSKGDPSYSWVAQRVAEHLKLPVKRYSLEPQRAREKSGR